MNPEMMKMAMEQMKNMTPEQARAHYGSLRAAERTGTAAPARWQRGRGVGVERKFTFCSRAFISHLRAD